MKERLDEHGIAMRAAKELPDGATVNLGYGIPTLASSYIPEGRRVVFHAEDGVLGYGPIITTPSPEDWALVNASGQPVEAIPGICFFDFAQAFDMMRGEHLDLAVLGALQVSEKGDLANWKFPGIEVGGIGGAMDLAVGAKRLIIAMEHTTRSGKPKIVRECSLEVTARGCVDLIVTDLAVIEVSQKGLILREIVPNWTVEEVQELTEPRLIIAEDLKEMEL